LNNLLALPQRSPIHQHTVLEFDQAADILQPPPRDFLVSAGQQVIAATQTHHPADRKPEKGHFFGQPIRRPTNSRH